VDDHPLEAEVALIPGNMFFEVIVVKRPELRSAFNLSVVASSIKGFSVFVCGLVTTATHYQALKYSNWFSRVLIILFAVLKECSSSQRAFGFCVLLFVLCAWVQSERV
jgi:hypothetical protein